MSRVLELYILVAFNVQHAHDMAMLDLLPVNPTKNTMKIK